MTVIWLTRHAETATPTVFHGAESDVGLSGLGRRQADAAAGWFREQGPTAVVSSGMKRAIDTAAPIAAACGVPHLVEPDLHERKVGSLSGTPFSPNHGAWPETVRRWSAGETGFTTPGAESLDGLRARLLPVWVRIAAAHPGGRVVVVAHGVVCKALLVSVLAGRTAADWVRLGRVPNLAVSELVPGEGGWEAVRLLQLPPPVAVLTAGDETPMHGAKSEG